MTDPGNQAEDQDLGEMEGDEEFTFPPAERRLVTQPVDLSVHTLLEQWNSGLLFLPDIQRQYVWDNAKASRLIESLLLNIPIPVLYFAETPEAKYQIIDGHQRVRSIVRFLSNEFSLSSLAVLDEYKGARFHSLPDREQRFLRMRTLRAVIITIESHPSMKFEIFERLNSGAVALNAQELRNSIHRGGFNNLLHELAKHKHLRMYVGSKAPRKRMVDEELILRFFALRSMFDRYRPPLKRFLNDYMESMSDASTEEIGKMAALFDSTMRRVSRVMGPSAFRVTDKNGAATEMALNRALFDAQMVACSWIVDFREDKDYSLAAREVFALCTDEKFLDAIRRATGDRARTARRLRETVAALERGCVSVAVPYDLSK